MSIFDREDDDGHHVLRVGEVHTLPLGRRLGLVSAAAGEAVIAFVGSDSEWSGGVAVREGEAVVRGGLHLRLTAVSCCPAGVTAEFAVTPASAA